MKASLLQGTNSRTLKNQSLGNFFIFFRQRGNSNIAEQLVAVIDIAPCHGGENRQVGHIVRFTGKGVSGLMYQIEAERQGKLEAHAQCDNGLDVGLRFIGAVSILADRVLVDEAQASQSLVSQAELVHVVGQGRSELTGQLVHDGGGLLHIGLELWRVGGDVTDRLIECGILIGGLDHGDVLGCLFLMILHSYALSAWAGKGCRKAWSDTAPQAHAVENGCTEPRVPYAPSLH